MILGFSTEIDKKPTYFVERIQLGILMNLPRFEILNEYVPENSNVEILWNNRQKLHTIREDKNDRWQPGKKIDFFINCRQKNMFRFAPVLPVVSVQNFEITWIGFNDGFRPWVRIDGKLFYDVAQIHEAQMLELAQNDGFDTVEQFFEYFNKDFKGKIIHWTDKKY